MAPPEVSELAADLECHRPPLSGIDPPGGISDTTLRVRSLSARNGRTRSP